MKIATILLSLFIIAVASWWYSGRGINATSDSMLNDIKDKVATDAVDQYNIAVRQGDKIQICVQAGLVSAAYLQAKNESKYIDWKDIETARCRDARVPR